MYILGVLGIGILLGLVGRFVMPGRHGLVKVVARDMGLLPRMVTGSVPGRRGVIKTVIADVPLRWTLLVGVVGSFVGYLVGGRFITANGADWGLSVAGAVALLALSAFGLTFQRTARTRRLGLRRRDLSLT
jgi:hypothetical protein